MKNKIYLSLSVDAVSFTDNVMATMALPDPVGFYLNDGITFGLGHKSKNMYVSKERVVLYSHKEPNYDKGLKIMQFIEGNSTPFSVANPMLEKPDCALYMHPVSVYHIINALINERDKWVWGKGGVLHTRTVIIDTPDTVRELSEKMLSERKGIKRSLDRLLLDKDIVKFAYKMGGM